MLYLLEKIYEVDDRSTLVRAFVECSAARARAAAGVSNPLPKRVSRTRWSNDHHSTVPKYGAVSPSPRQNVLHLACTNVPLRTSPPSDWGLAHNRHGRWLCKIVWTLR